MNTWSDIRALLESEDELPDHDEVLALLTPRDRAAAAPSLAWVGAALNRNRPAWQADGLCHEYPELSWFPAKGQPTAPAKAVCSRCLVRPECLSYAIDNDEVGIWGGTSPQERRVMRRDEAA